MSWRDVRRGLWIAFALAVLEVCLFADSTQLRGTHVLGPALAEIAGVLRDPRSQWMVFGCAGIYLLAFAMLRKRLSQGVRMATRWKAYFSVEMWLAGLMALAALNYALGYSQAAQSTYALALIGAAMIGQGAGLWQSREQKVESRNAEGGSPKSKVQCPKPSECGVGEGGSPKFKVQSPKPIIGIPQGI
jgi:hypothetical protein